MNDERKKYVIIFHSKSEQLYTLIKYKTTYEYTVIQPEKARDQKKGNRSVSRSQIFYIPVWYLLNSRNSNIRT